VLQCYCNAANLAALSAASIKVMGYRDAGYIAGDLNGYRELAQ
jgi:phage shock protein E